MSETPSMSNTQARVRRMKVTIEVELDVPDDFSEAMAESYVGDLIEDGVLAEQKYKLTNAEHLFSYYV